MSIIKSVITDPAWEQEFLSDFSEFFTNMVNNIGYPYAGLTSAERYNEGSDEIEAYITTLFFYRGERVTPSLTLELIEEYAEIFIDEVTNTVQVNRLDQYIAITIIAFP